MTIMIDRFFGLHQDVIRAGIWKQMRPGEKDLYVFLMHQSERNRTRQMVVLDADISLNVGVAQRTLCNARKKLQERGMISYSRGSGGKFTYEICNPATRRPYPGHHRQRVVVPKVTPTPKASVPHSRPSPPTPKIPLPPTEDELSKHGLAGIFSPAV
jgi:hypothetical protein